MTNPIEIIHNLKESGFSQQQSESLVEAILKLETANLATKTDIAALKTDFVELKGEVNILKLMVGGVYALLIPVLLKLFLR